MSSCKILQEEHQNIVSNKFIEDQLPRCRKEFKLKVGAFIHAEISSPIYL